MVNLYRWLSRKNIVIGSSSGEEVTSIRMPNDYFKGMSVTQMKKSIKNIKLIRYKLETLLQKNSYFTGIIYVVFNFITYVMIKNSRSK